MNRQAPCAAGNLQLLFEPKVGLLMGCSQGQGCFLKTDAKAPSLSLSWTGRSIRGRVPRQKHPNRVLPRGAAPPTGGFQICHTQRRLALCLHPLFNVTPIRGESLQLLTPTECTVALSLSSVGMTTSCSTTQLRKTSLPICVSRGGSHIQFKATQWANVEESRAVISGP